MKFLLEILREMAGFLIFIGVSLVVILWSMAVLIENLRAALI